jgi:arsenate reductase (thioredoxin)
MDRKPKVLFFSTGNATRSRMAQAFLRRVMGDKIASASTAVISPDANPLAVEVMREVGVDISDEKPDGVKESLKEHYVCVVTLSDDSKERSPVWPFTRSLVHWNLPDPGAIDGRRNSDGKCSGAFAMRLLGGWKSSRAGLRRNCRRVRRADRGNGT